MKYIKYFFVGMGLSVFSVMLLISLILGAIDLTEMTGWFACMTFLLFLIGIFGLSLLWGGIGYAWVNLGNIVDDDGKER